jgi:hypothetical protein
MWILKNILKGICFAIIIALAIFAFGYITMHLWNWLMPDIFGLKTITYWQALGLLILGKILFSGFGGKGGRHGCGHRGWHGHHRGGMWKKRWEEKMANMTPEEREKFKRGWDKCSWGHYDSYCEDEKKPDTKIQDSNIQ